MTAFLQVKDNAFARSPADALNNTDANIVISSLDTTKLPEVTTGFAVTIWDDVNYPDPGDDPDMEKCLVSAANIDANGSLTLIRGNAHAHSGTPKIALLMLAQHINDITAAVNIVETQKADKTYVDDNINLAIALALAL